MHITVNSIVMAGMLSASLAFGHGKAPPGMG